MTRVGEKVAVAGGGMARPDGTPHRPSVRGLDEGSRTHGARGIPPGESGSVPQMRLPMADLIHRLENDGRRMLIVRGLGP